MQQQLRTLLIVSATCLLAAAEARALSTITETAIEDGPTVVMENGFVRAVFRPEKGGMCTQFLCKTSGKRFVAPYTGSLLGTRVWNYTDRELYFQWERMPWSHEALRRAGEVELVMRAPGTVDFTRATTFEKRLVLRDDEAMLRVMYTFSVGQQLVNPPKIGLWFRNTTTVVGERTVYRFPLDDGILTLDPAGGTASSFLYNPTRGWAAAAGENEAGLCFMMEYRRLMAFHQHVRKEVTVEWAFRTMAIKNGDSFSTRQLLVPFAGIESVQGGGGGVVAGFSGPETYTVDQARAGIALHAQLNAGMPQDGELVVSTRRLPKGEDTPVCRRRLALKPGTLAETDVELVLPEGGTWFVQGEWLRDGRVVMDFVKPLTIGEASGSVRLAPKERRLGRVSERFEDRVPLAGGAPKDLKLSTEVESPHIKWAKPHCGGRLRVLVLTSPHTGREAVELAQRLDMEILWVTAGTEYELNGISNWFPSRYQVAHMNQNIKQELLHPCDAIIIAGLRGSLFTDEVLDLFRRKVEEGAGLIYIGPTKGADKLYEFLPVEREKRIRCRAEPWKAVGSHAITTGVPLDRLPSTACMRSRGKRECQ